MSVPTNSCLNHLSAAKPNVMVGCLNYLAVIGSDSNIAREADFSLRATRKRPSRDEALYI